MMECSESKEVGYPIGESALFEILRLLGAIERPAVIYDADPLVTANRVISKCAEQARAVRSLLPEIRGD
jgi:hypothetical protein